jgi:tetratricopeptide (TPR) repeat protein
MSYIHKALKKAQKEKETRHHKYNGIVSTPGHKPRLFSAKALWLTPFFLISLAFAAYLWLPSTGTQPPIREPARPEATPQSKPAPQPQVTPQPLGVANAAALYEKARVLHRSGRLQEAMRLYEKALSLDPDYVYALNNVGVIHIHNRMYPAARACFEKAIRHRPDYVDPYYNLACLHALEGGVSQSLIHLKKAVSLDQSVKDWARRDADLGNLRGVPEFEEIIGPGRE